MEQPFRLLVVLGLLAALLPAAAATFGPQPGACEPTLIATHVALFCTPDMPTAQCCEPVVAAVDLGGGVSCLCRVASEPQLVMAGVNATHLLTLYTSCGGLRPGGAHLAAACEGPAPPAAADVSSTPPSPAAIALTMHANTCDSAHMAGQLVDSCDHAGDTPSWLCCQIAYAVVERSCLCLVSEEAQVRTSASLGRSKILFLYELCGNTKEIGKDDCGPVAPPPPPAQEPVIPPVDVKGKGHARLGVILGCSIGGGLALIGVAYGLYKMVLCLRSRGHLGGQLPVNSREAAKMRADAAEARMASAQATS